MTRDALATPEPDPCQDIYERGYKRGLREALETILDICKPMSMSGPVWFDGGTPAGGGSRERIWRICNAALADLDANVEETP